MIIHSINSELWWFGNSDEIRSVRSLSLQEIINTVAGTFNFFAWPTKIPGPQEGGFNFDHGILKEDGSEEIVIRQLVIYQAAIHLTVAGNSNCADRVLEKLIEIFLKMGARIPSTPPLKYYRSTIVCDFDKTIDPLFSHLEKITSFIQAGVSNALARNVAIHASGIAFSGDPSTLPKEFAVYNPTLFSINRKTDIEFSRNRCTCFANMKTDDHLKALKEIEGLFDL